MKLLFLFLLSTSPLTLFEISIYLIPLLMVELCIWLVYCVKFSASNDDGCTILSTEPMRLPKSGLAAYPSAHYETLRGGVYPKRHRSQNPAPVET